LATSPKKEAFLADDCLLHVCRLLTSYAREREREREKKRERG
jgi:hypothetical protein